MKTTFTLRLLPLALPLLGLDRPLALAETEPVRVVVEAAAAGVAISPQLYGVFFEDINFAGDGGLSAELVKNGSFEFADPIFGWKKLELPGAVGGYGVPQDQPRFVNNPHYARLTIETPGAGFGLRNEGYRGMGFEQGARYHFSAFVRLVAGDAQPLRIELLGANDKVIGRAQADVAAHEWARLETELTADATEVKGALRLLLKQTGVVDLDAVSLVPVRTWKNRPNGLRADLVQMLADLKPGFIRFPGGCIVEGRTLENRYQWKRTIGPVEERPVIYNRWNVEFAGSGHGAADYYQTFRVGFFEYFQLCADLGAEPLPILNCGMACQYNSGELAPVAALDPYVQDALDLIEFANGPVEGKWGRVRAELGHPAPFGLKFIGVGNEQWGPQYFERYSVFAQAIRAHHPEIKLVFSAGPRPDDGRFRSAWDVLARLPADIVDEHSYAPPEWFLDQSARYDRQDRHGPKIFMGEYAAHVASRHNTWEAALAEAAFLTGLERNAEVVAMSSYAPLFAHVDAWQWSPNLIWFDNLHAYGTPSYFVQQLFSRHRGDRSLPVKVEHPPLAANGQPRLYVTASRDEKTGELVLKVVNATATDQTVTLALDGAAGLATTGRMIVLTAAPDDENSLAGPTKVAPREEDLTGVAAEFVHRFPAGSVSFLCLPAKP
jgi:alpha-L-arabinofuranosidase